MPPLVNELRCWLPASSELESDFAEYLEDAHARRCRCERAVGRGRRNGLRRDLAKGAVGVTVGRVLKVGVIQNVEEVCAESEPEPLGHGKRFLHVQVRIEVAGSAEGVARVGVEAGRQGAARKSAAGRGEAWVARVGTGPERGFAPGHWCVEDGAEEGAVGREIAARQIALLPPADDAEWKARAVEEGAGDLPSANDCVDQTVRRVDGEIPDVIRRARLRVARA